MGDGWKYDGNMDGDPAWLLSKQDVAQVDFDLERLNPQSIWGKLKDKFGDVLKPLVFWLMREFFPRFSWDRLQFITRYEDVVAVLKNQQDFLVHFNPEIRVFAGGRSTFMLGLNGVPHDCQRRAIAPWFTDSKNREMADLTTEIAHKMLDASGGHIDVIKDYFTRVSAEVGIQLLGIDVDDPDAFADWTIAMSNANFADAKGTAVSRELASHAAWRQKGVVDRSIAQALGNPGSARELMRYLIQPDVLGNDADSIRSVIFGVSVALAPTITIGAGNMLAYLQSNPEAMAQAVAAARDGNRDRLETLLLEAGRLSPALNPGQFRYAPHDVDLPGGPFGSTRVKANSVVLVGTAIALRDRRVFAQPGRFLPDRDGARDKSWLMFGAGPHLCLGADLAIAQLTRLFEALLSRNDIAFAPGADGRLHRVGAFPRQQFMDFAIPRRPRDQAMIICSIPVPADNSVKLDKLRAQIRSLRPMDDHNSGANHVTKRLDETNIIHFSSINLIDASIPGRAEYQILVEVRADGDANQALVNYIAAIGEQLNPIFAMVGFNPDVEGLARFFARHRLDVRAWPAGATGLHYIGSREFSVDTKDREKNLAQFASDAVDLYQRRTSGNSPRPIAAINFVRALIRGDRSAIARALIDTDLPLVDPEIDDLVRHGKDYRGMLYVPSRQRLEFAEWRDTSTWTKIRRGLFGSVGPIKVALLAGFVAFMTLIIAAVAPRATAVMVMQSWWIVFAGASRSPVVAIVGTVLLALIAALGLVALFAAISSALFYWKIRQLEIADRPDDRDPDPRNLQEIAVRENAVGYQQNHIIAVSDTKPGFIRRLSFAIAMWGIGVLVTYWFRPGFIATMGTIHFASWVRLPESGKLVFLSNYDGSWDSYLEDFITKVPSGQTAAWSHATGFPRTTGLIGAGARDGDRFKRWVRRQQRPTDFWYSRLPDLTLDRARTNALIHHGLARAASDTAAREWLCNFGSSQRTDAMIEADEIQTIVFRGLPGRRHGAVILFSLPPKQAGRAQFIKALLGKDSAPKIPPIAFGEMRSGGTIKGSVAFASFSASGLRACGLPDRLAADGLASFPFAFTEGMRSRARILGDPLDGAGFDWDDRTALHDASNRPLRGDVHGLLQILAETDCQRGKDIAAITALLDQLGGKVVLAIPTDPPFASRPQRDHFGFRDGISQPTIRGSFRDSLALDRDLVEPGEFLFGYRGNQGYVAPSPRLAIEHDPRDLLPDVTVEPASRFPAARKQQEASSPFRDFGRNGCFLVARQLDQYTDDFFAFAKIQATIVNKQYRGLAATLGTELNAEWIAAKMVGRWPDGEPLTYRIGQPDDQQVYRSGEPAAPSGERSDGSEPSWPVENDPKRANNPYYDRHVPTFKADFSFAREDPRGLACPLGSHVRRTNPRDSLVPDDTDALSISNRHRILRRGRSYAIKCENGTTRKGLVFIALCSDIERQFEFIQQRWIGGSSFHGLENETDPVVANRSKITARPASVDTAKTDNGAVFSIPTTSGTVRLKGLPAFVTPRGGGYFFLPSKSALKFLAQIQDTGLD